jgi:hypothetical protein
LIGPQAETLVWLYCTVSQRCVYERVRALDAIPPDGLPVKNCHTGQRQQLPAVWAARLLVLLAADIAEQVGGGSADTLTPSPRDCGLC